MTSRQHLTALIERHIWDMICRGGGNAATIHEAAEALTRAVCRSKHARIAILKEKDVVSSR